MSLLIQTLFVNEATQDGQQPGTLLPLSFPVCRGISANGGKPFTACFTGINGDGEPLFGLGTFSTGMPEVKEVLALWKAVIERTGGTVRLALAASPFLPTAPTATLPFKVIFCLQQPRIFYLDWEGMEAIFRELWPDGIFLIDIWHIINGYGSAVDDNHSMKHKFMVEIAACLLVPYLTQGEDSNAHLLESYRQSHNLTEVDFASTHFRKWWSDKKQFWWVVELQLLGVCC